MASSKTYLRYAHQDSFGVVAAHECNIAADAKGAHVLTSGVQDVLVWNLQTGELVHKFRDADTAGNADPYAVSRELTALALGPGDRYLATGDGAGTIKLWAYQDKTFMVALNGHRSAVTTLCFSKDNARLASGSRDTDIILWDLVAQAGLFRLRGHKQEVTDLRFLKDGAQLLSSSKDMLLKTWDLETQHCVDTFVGHRSPVWSVDVNGDEDRIVSASSDQQLRGFARLSDEQRTAEMDRVRASGALSNVQTGAGNAKPFDASSPWRLLEGSITRGSAERAQTIRFSPNGQLIGCQTAGKTLEIFRLRSPDEVAKKAKRRIRRANEKKKKKKDEGTAHANGSNEDGEEADETDDASLADVPHFSDEVEAFAQIRTDHRMRSFAFTRVTAHKAEIVVSYNTNQLELYTLSMSEVADDQDQPGQKRKRQLSLQRTREIELQGHRNDVRAVALSGDDSLVLTAGNGAAKLWNVKTRACIRTFRSGYSLCCAFVPGDMHAIVGTRSGHLIMFNLASGDILSDVAAHDDAIWSIDVRPDGKGFVTGSADKQVKFWEFELVDANADADADDAASVASSSSSSSLSSSSSSSAASSEAEAQAAKRPKTASASAPEPTSGGKLEFVHTRTLKMNEDVMGVKYSHHQSSARLILAVALLDCTVKVFFEDSLKFALSLYGHKLPVLSMDISDDNALIATASADKNVKVWGLDFGDCHKSFFAHDASVMCVRFIPRTHYMLTAGKDQRVRYWDADKFEMILSLEAHVGEVWSLAVASDGSYFVSSGHDKALRVWERTNDIVFPDEEREKALEQQFDAKLLSDRKADSSTVQAVREADANGDDDADPSAAATGPESAAASKRTTESLRVGERLMEALDVADERREALKAYEVALKDARSQASKKELAKANKRGEPLVHPPAPNPLMLGRDPVAYVMHILRSIKSSELDEALMLQPFSYAVRIFPYLHEVLVAPRAEGHLMRQSTSTEVAVKVAVALLRVHFKQIVATQTLKSTLVELRGAIRDQLSVLQDQVGTNMAAMRALKTQVASNSSRGFA